MTATCIVCLCVCSIVILSSYAFHQQCYRCSVLQSNLWMQSSSTPSSNVKKQQFNLGKIAFSLVPLSPESVGRRKSILTEVVKGKVWTIDQVQGIINVNTPVRCTIIKLSNGIFINNPVAPTQECIEYVRNIEVQCSMKVKYIALSSLAIEHKGTTGVFSSYFPDSSIYIQPGQYSFPIDLPSAFFFPFGKKIVTIDEANKDALPFSSELDFTVLGPLRPPGVGGFSETAFFHTETSTLLVTDTVVRIDDVPPPIIQDDPRALLYHARDTMLEVIEDTTENRNKGWRRMVLFGLTFQPSGINVFDTFDAIKMLGQVTPEMTALGAGAIPIDGGLYPWGQYY